MELLRDDEENQELEFVINGIPRRIFQRMDFFNHFDEDTFYKRFRMSKNTSLFVLNLIEGDIEHPYDFNNSVAPINQLLVFLRVCATGSHLTLIGDFSGMHYSTVSRIMRRVGTAIARRAGEFIKMPNTQEDMDKQNLLFYEKAHFPRVLGVIDCTHIRIQSPGGDDGEIYRNRKGYFSLNTQIISDADLKITNIVARWPGATHDSTIFNNSQIKQAFEQNDFPNCLLLGDSGYFQRPYLLTPIINPQNRGQQLYNEAHIRTRNIIERVNGIIKRRFPILAYGCRLKLDTLLIIIVALAVLHNICREQNEAYPPEPEDLERFLRRMEEDVVPNIPPVDQAVDLQAIASRDQMVNYFANLH